ncbi:hypothetical protein CNMCM7691_002345 [Aspergillus felis]|uniref:Alpha/beta hydrolase fold-3 domain-containing protein n=1 Tax=Aspergillus felis TaxID=1287682 RepID=A0A8H6VC20_9EURO|nr:hypothetical protein CNMCM7691_002345 [Aspergillus felis]
MQSNKIPTTASRASSVAVSLARFLKDHPNLHLGGDADFHRERREHLEILGFYALPAAKQAAIGKVEVQIVPGPHGSIPIRLFYPQAILGNDTKDSKVAALVYMHGGGYTVGSIDEFENGLRLLAEAAGAITIGVEYHLAPEHHFPTQLDEYSAVIDWAQGVEGSSRGIDPDLVFGGGDSAGGNMTEAIALRRRDQKVKNIAGQLLLYPESRPPFDTPAAVENNTGGSLYLVCNGIFSFADHYLSKEQGKTVPPSNRYVSPGMQSADDLHDLPPAALFTCGFDPLRDVGVEYGNKLQQAGVDIRWHHYANLTHGFLQFAPWSQECMDAVMDVAQELKRLAGGTG